MTRITSSFRDDRFNGEELEEAIELGEVGYCEIGQHHDWSDNVHGYTRIEDPTDTISFCDDCEPQALVALVEAAIGPSLDHAEARQRVLACVTDHYDPLSGGRLIEAIEMHRSPDEAAAKKMSDKIREARGEFQLGPLLADAAARAAKEAREEFGDKIEEADLDQDWWMEAIHLHFDEPEALATIADTPDTLAYLLDFDELHEDYSTQAATPGWMIGEAAWRLVRDEARKQLGLPSRVLT